jgi:transcription initiation factor TFIID subunit TAF12
MVVMTAERVEAFSEGVLTQSYLTRSSKQQQQQQQQQQKQQNRRKIRLMSRLSKF